MYLNDSDFNLAESFASANFVIAQPAYTVITQIVDFYSKIYTLAQPFLFKTVRHYFIDIV